MIQAGSPDQRRIVCKSAVQIHISPDTRYPALICELPDTAVCAVEVFAVPGIPECVAFPQVIAQISIYKIPVAVKHGEISSIFYAAAEASDKTSGKGAGKRNTLSAYIVGRGFLNIVTDRVFQTK